MSMTEIAYMDERAYGNPTKAPQAMMETELTSLLGTIGEQAHDIKRLAESMLNRTAPQPEADCGTDAKLNIGGGYVGKAEGIRSTQRAAIELLNTLSKFI